MNDELNDVQFKLEHTLDLSRVFLNLVYLIDDWACDLQSVWHLPVELDRLGRLSDGRHLDDLELN